VAGTARQLIGLLFWPGALFYVLYNYIAYVFGMLSNMMFLLYSHWSH